MITFVCIYNNVRQLIQMLLPSLGVDTHVELGLAFPASGITPCRHGNLLLIDNRGGYYKSAAVAYNRELSIHQKDLNDILVFCHQDIVFDGEAYLGAITSAFAENPRRILGVAGMPKEGRTISNLKYYGTMEYITRTQLAQPTIVESLDECCFALRKDFFFLLLFNEHICDHWHLYAVELCYRARTQKNAESVVLPCTDVFHKMDGKGGLYVDRYFLSALWRLTMKYRKQTTIICTPCFRISTNPLIAAMKIFRTFFKNSLNGLIRNFE